MAGLPGSSAMVWVGPPLSPSVPRPGFATPTWLPFVPFVRPPGPPVPSRLNALAEDTARGMSSGVAGPGKTLTLRATIELFSVAVPPALYSPPPEPGTHPAFGRPLPGAVRGQGRTPGSSPFFRSGGRPLARVGDHSGSP